MAVTRKKNSSKINKEIEVDVSLSPNNNGIDTSISLFKDQSIDNQINIRDIKPVHFTLPGYKDWLSYYTDEHGKQRILVNKIDYTKRKNSWGVKPTKKEGMIINPKVAVQWDINEIIDSIPYEWIKRNKAFYGELCDLSLTDPVRNLNWDFLKFNDSSVFQPAANAFRANKAALKGKSKPYYTNQLPGTTAYKEYWEEEGRRIKFGYEPIIDGEPCGLRISGEFYFYLNYSLVLQTKKLPNGSTKDEMDFPRFLAMDYYWFKELEAREEPHIYGFDLSYKQHLSCVKTRRAGFSYKEAAGCARIICFENNSRVAIASAPSKDKTDAALAAKKCIPIIDHLTEYTPFGRVNEGNPKFNGGWKHELISNTEDFVKITMGSFNTKTGAKRGRQSTLFTISLGKDDAASGEGLRRLYFEEAGKIDNLIPSFTFASESMRSGQLIRGLIIAFGTGGEMVSKSGNVGSSKGLSELHYKPGGYHLASFDNIYEFKQVPGAKSGFFVTSFWCHFGAELNIEGKKYEALDQNGNALFWVANLVLNYERKAKEPPASKLEEYNRYLTQKCYTASEAFLITQGNVFQTADLIARQREIKTSARGFDQFRTIGQLVNTSGEIKFQPDIHGKLNPIVSADSRADRDGALILYETPKRINGVIPIDAYLITVDPIGQDTSSGKSNSAVFVLKNPMYFNEFGSKFIVATYVGRERENPLTSLHSLLKNLCLYYNAKLTYETDNSGGQILKAFQGYNMLGYLLSPPVQVLSKGLLSGGSATDARKFGHSLATSHHKTIAERLTYEILDSIADSYDTIDSSGNEHHVKKRFLDLLEDELLLEQLIIYNRDINLDAATAFLGGIMQLKEHYIKDESDDNTSNSENSIASQLYLYYEKRTGITLTNPYDKQLLITTN